MSLEQATRITAVEAGTIEPLLERWRNTHPAMGVLAFVPEARSCEVPALQSIFRHSETPLLGALFPAVIDHGEFTNENILLLRLDTMPPYLLAEGVAGDQGAMDSLARAIAAKLPAQESEQGEQATLFLLFDAMLPHIGQILEALYLSLADQVHYMGANAGSETFQPMPCLFDQQRFIQNGLLALLLPHHPGAILNHGYHAPEQFVAATSTEGNRIINIDWRPAFEVYNERVLAQYGVEITRDNFYQYAVHFPFGIIRADGEIQVRIPVALQEDGSLFCVGEIPPNAILTLLDAPTAEATHTVEQLIAQLQMNYAEAPLISFYCAGRRLHLGGEGAQHELDVLARALGKERLFGALSLGEIGGSRRGGYPLFHNAAIILSGW